MPTPPIIVVGAGLAGLSTALALAPAPVLLLAAAPPGHGAASPWAQGGIAAAIGADDSPALHAADTLAAGDGLNDPRSVARITAQGPALIARLAALGVAFDRGPDGAFALGLEAAHSRRRIVHAGDSTGAAIMRALAARVAETLSITLRIAPARRLYVQNGRAAGVVLQCGTVLPAAAVVLATGGTGGLYLHTTNPITATGQGLVMAARAGAALTDLEFVQFHPTALDTGEDPMPLVSEAVRGEGATLLNAQGLRFMAGQGRAELSPRDVVARAVAAQRRAGQVFLDATHIQNFTARFPAIAGFCARAGLNPARDPIPIATAAHYHMGGIAVDEAGRTSLDGLYACGECAATGLHGANRLASNSLLEAGVCGTEIADAILSSPLPHPTTPAAQPKLPPADATAIRPIVSQSLGVLRNGPDLEAAIATLHRRATTQGPESDPAHAALLIAVAAHARRESRGAHARTDHPHHAPTATRQSWTLQQALAYAEAHTHAPAA